MRYRATRGNYTVEATFIMLISITVIISIIYYLMWRHDATVIDSTVHLVLDNEDSCEKKKDKILKTLNESLFVSEIVGAKVTTKLFTSQADINYRLKVHIPFLDEGDLSSKVSHVYFIPSNKMWDYTILKEGWDEIRGSSRKSSENTTNGS